MHFSPQELMALLAASSFAAGLNIYGTVATLGLLGRFDVLPLPPGLEAMGHWPIITTALVMFVIEFFADKIPYFDLIWNALHTFIRIPLATFIAYQASAQLSPGAHVSATILGGVLAAIAHTSKTAVRAGVTPSPEPVSNVALSTVEDVGAIGLTWFASHHPYIAAGIVAVLIVALFFVTRFIVRSIRSGYRQVRERFAT